MKKIFQIGLVYAFGILCVLSLVWRASSLDKNSSYSLNYNESNYVYNN